MNAIEFDNVGKLYKLGLVSTGTLSDDLNRWWKTKILHKEDPYLKIGETNDRSTKGTSDYVWALRDISFNVEQGDVVGIIGKNGAGKSTLLKLLSRVTSPTTGQIRARGRIGSLLEVGTGFHPELTGRENIYMNGSIMGMTKHEIDRKLDEIVDFSGCERYIDTPTKRYSSGMTVRLGFAVAAFMEPEILVVDEVLAVGDAEFQKKAIGKMKDVSKGGGRTVLFVSHNMNSIKQLCTQGVVLEKGSVVYRGSVIEAVNFYLGSKIDTCKSHTIITDDYRDDNGVLKHELKFEEAWLVNPSIDAIATDEPIVIKVKVRRYDSSVKSTRITVIIINELDQRILYCPSQLVQLPTDSDEFCIENTIKYHGLPKGRYTIRLEASLQSFTQRTKGFDWVHNVLSFEVKYTDRQNRYEYLNWNSFNGLVIPSENMIETKICT